MRKFTNNAFDFVNGCIGNNKEYRIIIRGDFNINTHNVGSLWYAEELKEMIITEIEVQYNEIYLMVRKKDKIDENSK